MWSAAWWWNVHVKFVWWCYFSYPIMHILVWWLWIPLYTSPLRDTILRFPIFQASLLHDQVPSAILWCTAAALDISWYNHDSQPPDLKSEPSFCQYHTEPYIEHFRLTVSPFNLSHVTRKKCVCVCARIRLCPASTIIIIQIISLLISISITKPYCTHITFLEIVRHNYCFHWRYKILEYL